MIIPRNSSNNYRTPAPELILKEEIESVFLKKVASLLEVIPGRSNRSLIALLGCLISLNSQLVQPWTSSSSRTSSRVGTTSHSTRLYKTMSRDLRNRRRRKMPWTPSFQNQSSNRMWKNLKTKIKFIWISRTNPRFTQVKTSNLSERGNQANQLLEVLTRVCQDHLLVNSLLRDQRRVNVLHKLKARERTAMLELCRLKNRWAQTHLDQVAMKNLRRLTNRRLAKTKVAFIWLRSNKTIWLQPEGVHVIGQWANQKRKWT